MPATIIFLDGMLAMLAAVFSDFRLINVEIKTKCTESLRYQLQHP